MRINDEKMKHSIYYDLRVNHCLLCVFLLVDRYKMWSYYCHLCRKQHATGCDCVKHGRRAPTDCPLTPQHRGGREENSHQHFLFLLLRLLSWFITVELSGIPWRRAVLRPDPPALQQKLVYCRWTMDAERVQNGRMEEIEGLFFFFLTMNGAQLRPLL